MLAGIGLLLLFALSLSWAWAALGLVPRTPQAVMSTGTVVLFPLTLASNVFVATQTMPGWLQAFVYVNLVSHLATAERGLLSGHTAIGQVSWSADHLRRRDRSVRAPDRLALRQTPVTASPGQAALRGTRPVPTLAGTGSMSSRASG